jgi:hypothetical protein
VGLSQVQSRCDKTTRPGCATFFVFNDCEQAPLGISNRKATGFAGGYSLINRKTEMNILKIASILISYALLLFYAGFVMALDKEGSTSWKPQGSEFIYNEDGSTSRQPQGSDFIYNEDGTTSWQPQGSDFIDNEDGSTSMQPQGNDFINNR